MVKEFYIYAVVHFVSLQNIVMYKRNTKVTEGAEESRYQEKRSARL